MSDKEMCNHELDHIIEFIHAGDASGYLERIGEASPKRIRDELIDIRYSRQRDLDLAQYEIFLGLVADRLRASGFMEIDIWELELNRRIIRGETDEGIDYCISVFRDNRQHSWLLKTLIRYLTSNDRIEEARKILVMACFEGAVENTRYLIPLLEAMDGKFDYAEELLAGSRVNRDPESIRLMFLLLKIRGSFLEAKELLEAHKPYFRSYSHLRAQLDIYESSLSNSQLDLPVCVITLNKHSARMRRMGRRNAELGLQPRIISGFNATEHSSALLHKIGGSEFRNSNQRSNLTKMVGCFISHMAAWHYVVASKLIGCLIMEDDALLHISPGTLLQPEAIENYDLIFCNERMETELDERAIQAAVIPLEQALIHRARPGTIGTDVYWVSQRFAAEAISMASNFPWQHVDAWLVEKYTRNSCFRAGVLSPSLGAEYVGFWNV